MKINLTSRLSREMSSKPSVNNLRESLGMGGYYRHVYLLKDAIDNMTERGLPISVERLAEFKSWLEEVSKDVKLRIQQHIDSVALSKGVEFHSYHPSAEGFKVLPQDLRELINGREIIQTTTEIKRKRTYVESEGKNRMIPTEIEVPVAKYPCRGDLYQEWFYELVDEHDEYEWKIISQEGIYAIVKRVEFNPNSTQQLEFYCSVMGYTIPTATKKTVHGREQKQSLDDKALQKLGKLTKDPIFPMIETLREVGKLISTYVDGWKPNRADGRLHSEFSLNSGTGQLRSRKPNVQNAPSHSGEYGKKFKKIIRAREGRLILSIDWSGFHALMLGYFAESKDYMRLSQMGVHDYLAAHMLIGILNKAQGNHNSRAWQDCRGVTDYNGEGEGFEKELLISTERHLQDISLWLSLSDDNLRDKLKWIKKNHKFLRDKKSKPITHSIGFAAQAKGIYEKNEDSFSGIREVEALRDLYFQTFPAIARYQMKIGFRAHEEKKLVSPFGYVRRFYEAMTMKNGRLDKGEQFSEAVAFNPANTAHGLKKEVILRLEGEGWNERFCFFNEVHDSLMYEPLESEIELAAKIVHTEMTRPCPLLSHPILCPDGISCGAEVSWGPSWGELEEYKI